MRSTNPTRRAPSGRHHRLSRFGLAWLAGFVLLATWLGLSPSARPRISTNQPRSSARLAALADATHHVERPAATTNRVPRTKAIEDIRVGERVLGSNPLADGPLAAQDEALPDPATWKNVVLCLNEPGYGRLDIAFIQPPEWLVETGARVGGTVELDLPELGAGGEAKVLSIGPCPPIEPGDGAIVTGTFVHRSAGNLVDVRFEGVDEPDGVTDNHRYFSLDRGDFIEAGNLRRGERIQGAIESDVLCVASVNRRPADELVYNLQINGQHVYHVGSHGALVHNVCAGDNHFVPRGLGSTVGYGNKILTWMNKADHTSFHKKLAQHLNGYTKTIKGKTITMNPQRSSGATVRSTFSKQQRLSALRAFYRKNSQWQSQFQRELKYTLGNGKFK